MKLGFQVLCSVSLGLALIACSGDEDPTTDGGGMATPTTGGMDGPTTGVGVGPCDGVMCPAATMCNPATGMCDPTNMPCPCEKGSHCEPTTNTCAPGCKDNSDCMNGEMCDAMGACVPGCEGTLVPALTLSKVVLNQAVSIPLVENGAAIPAASRPAPVVQNRPGLLRVVVKPEANYVPTEVTAVLTLNNAGVETKLTATANVAAASSEATLEGTLNIKLDAAAITPTTQYKVELTQKACAATPGTGRFPGTGTQALEATKTGRFKVTIVPYEVAPNKLDVSPAALQGIKDALMAYYPVEGVDAEFHAPVSVPATMTLQKLLQEVRTLRATEKPTDDTYYFGLFTAAATFREFCKDGCVAGIATLGGAGDAGAAADRYGVGIGYLSETAITSHGMPTTEKAVTYNVMAHELGHTQGRPHSPCGDPAGLDMAFPNATADIETAGYNIVTGTFAAPMTHKDVMGYCDPNWIHPYTYNNLAKRVTAVSAVKGPLKIPGPVVEYASVLVQNDGESFWGNNFTLDEEPSGEKILARAFDASGAVVADELEVTITQLGEAGDVIATLPPPAANWAAVEINGHRVPVN